ncbi:MAG TPA: TetR/AcrR family transcriptional regulator [Leptolyngbyaceae cyanobacterium M33_DOE_097]|uniref:TetR/AcrR family transcriptional regulator n=1 Tax=Oscillatoriales cyanobacterium SpSt-418 TaxID=2282169 RepID=A0A7C3KB22_9CYAN|nr:TetR/AcrR family transcriptional regulator [Leptolyngbyaceae cyanobacterium M33_DOE_097]
MPPTQPPSPARRRSTTQGRQTRQAILKTAVNVASVEGLEGLSIGRLASELGMSKSGLFAHFGSKEELQLAAIATAQAIFINEVIRPTRKALPGMTRLYALMEAWLAYGERKVFAGGCFFAAAAMEFDSRPGVVRDRLADITNQWLQRLEKWIGEAKERGEIRADVDAAQLAFELHTLMWGANTMLQLYDNAQVKNQMKTAIAHRLQSIVN